MSKIPNRHPMSEEPIPTSGKFNVQRHELQFRCEWAVFPDGGEASVCYCTDEARALLVAKALDEMFERKAKYDPPVCPYCGKKSEMIAGREMYPHRDDLANLAYYICKVCDASVGCNGKTGEPLGTLANKELRVLRASVHSVFDPLWMGAVMTRPKAYSWLAAALGIPEDQCHVAKFDEATCLKAYDLCDQRLRDRKPEEIPF